MLKLLIAALLFAMNQSGPAATSAPPEGEPPIEIMVIGTHHFDNPGLDLNNVKADDVLAPKRQHELEALATALVAFRPTKIMVERVAKDPGLTDHAYAAFNPEDLKRVRDERVQIAYRLAKLLGIREVHAIDEQPGAGEPDYFPFQAVAGWAKDKGRTGALDALMAKGAAAAKDVEGWLSQQSIGEVLGRINRPERVAAEQALYYQLLALGDQERQPGADLNAMWYLRNAKIFAKLGLAAKPGDRVIVLYGSGHAYWLRHFASTAPGYRNVDPLPYLQAASKAR